jgi:hypothetical protein
MTANTIIVPLARWNMTSRRNMCARGHIIASTALRYCIYASGHSSNSFVAVSPILYNTWEILHATKALGGEKSNSSYLLTSALDGGEWSASRPGERTPGTHCTGGWVGSRASLDTVAKGKIHSPLPGIEPRSPGLPARSQTLYWLSYPEHV